MRFYKLFLLLSFWGVVHFSYAQRIIISPNHYQITIPDNWNSLNKNRIDEILKAREEQSGIISKHVVTEAIIVKHQEFSVPNMQILFNKMNLTSKNFSEFATVFTKIIPEAQKDVLEKWELNDKILKSDFSHPFIDYETKMYLYTLKQEVAGIGTVIVVSANFMANKLY